MNTVSVVIPCFDAAPYIRDALDSVLAQSHSPIEVVVVDDGSSDESANIAESYGSPVRVIRQLNQGESVARNRGLDEARGDWIAFLDADDKWVPSKLKLQLEAADQSTVCVHNNVQEFGNKSNVSCIESVDEVTRYSIEALAVRNCFITPSAMLVRRAASPRFPSWTRIAEDHVYCLDLVQMGNVRFLPAPLTLYRRTVGLRVL